MMTTSKSFETSVKNDGGIALLAFPEQADFLCAELLERFGVDCSVASRYGDLFYFKSEEEFFARTDGRLPYWARTALLSVFFLSFNSIGEAAAYLKSVQRNWASYQFTCFRRSLLIQEKLPYINLKDRAFPFDIPSSPMGLFSLLDEHTMIASAKTSSSLPLGAMRFIEDHENPPSRAYLKIQEALLLFRLFFDVPLPSENTVCLEAGACPGGWTWVLTGLGSRVFAVDRTELSHELMEHPLVTFSSHNAFTLKPSEIGKVDWVLSDVICYPNKLLEWIHGWILSGLTDNMICTIKMQGKIDWKLIAEFEQIKNSRIVHLNYNKHELTFLWHKPAAKENFSDVGRI